MTSPDHLWVRDANIFDGVSERLSSGDVLVRDGRIVEVGRVGNAPAGCPELDAAGRTLLPGLIDAHCHAYAISWGGFTQELAPLSLVALLGAERLASALHRGFTTVRDVAGGDLGLAFAGERGIIAAPRYLFTGPALSQTGGHGDPRDPEVALCFGRGHVCELVDGVEDLRLAVRERFRTGAHAIKVMTSGGVSSSEPLRHAQYSAEEIRAVVDEATRRGSYVAAHAYSSEAILHSLRNGVRTIEHGNLMDAEAARAMREHQALLVPTLAAHHATDRRAEELGLAPTSVARNREVLDAGREAIRLALSHDVPVGFGTDLLGPLHSDQLSGLELQADVIGAAGALRSATSVNARIVQRDDLGRIAPGAVADLLLVEGDPLEDIRAVSDPRAPRTVVQAGRVVHQVD